jgi:ankyrin repeat protein
VTTHHILQFGQTALHEAAWEGHVEVCKLLLAAGADVKIQGEVSYFEVEVFRHEILKNIN